jgi:zinc transporter 5/7
MEGIFLHILADTLGSVGVVISTLLIKYKGWLFTDPACSIFISVLIVSSVLPLVKNSAELLLQRVPRSAEKRLQKALRKVEEVEGVHDWHKLHVWSNTNTELVGTLRLHSYVGTNKVLVHRKVSRILEEAGILDLTLEVEDLEHKEE